MPLSLCSCRYLEQSVLALDPNKEVTRSHMAAVLRGLSQQLAEEERSLQGVTGMGTLPRQVRRLRMVSERMCQSQQS